MTLPRMILLLPFAFALAACNKDQPSGIPDAPASAAAPQQPAATTPATPPQQAPVAAVGAPPPPVQGDIPPYEKTGFPDCDDYVEAYRQCLNSRLGSDERKSKALELQESVRSIMSNIARGVDGARVASRCKRARSLASKKLTELGCPL